ncbi:MAG: hypothetical protein H0V17_26105 [Deltaproteobacteria bacterium]|nr:hypothetical protein [Deltaproteobacteria bacterium]
MRARDNPFGVDRLHALRFRGPGVEALWARARDLGRGALVGAEGSGKTTLLHALAAHVHAQGFSTIWIQLRRDARELTAEHRAVLAPVGSDHVVFVDGADLLPRLDRWWLVRRTRVAAAILGTLHAPGWLPTLAQLSTSPALLDDLVRELTGRSVHELAVDRDALYARHHGNLRAALRELYDQFAVA